MKITYGLIICAGALAAEAALAQTTNLQPPGAPAVAASVPGTNAPTEAAPANAATGSGNKADASSSAVEQAIPAPSAAPGGTEGTNEPPQMLASDGTPGLRMNFRGVPLEMVLNYLSEAAGFIINLETTPRGRVDVWSNQPLTKEEAVNLLNTVLRKNGYAAIRNDRMLTIVSRDEAKIHDIPVKLGSDPASIPRNDEMVTQIIPVRFVEVTQLVKDLQPLVSVQTTMTANEAGNSIVITDTQANIRRVAEIIKAIDTGAEDVTEVRVFHLTYSDPSEISDLLANLFPDESRSGGSGSSSPVQFGFSRFFSRFGGGSPGSSSSGSNAQNQRIKKRARVIAVPDARTASVVVTAGRDLMPQIEAVIAELDSNPARKQTVHVYQLQNADASEVQQVLEDMFERNTTQSSRSSQNQTSTLRNRSNQQQNTTSGQGTSRLGVGGAGRTGSFGTP